MKPVLIFQHVACEGPGYLAQFLRHRGMNYRVIRVDEGEGVPRDLDDVAALVFMGGPMSVNDNLPWLQSELELIRTARHRRMPVLGHCLGGQLISRALGGEVGVGEQEFGWFPVRPANNEQAPAWLSEFDYSTEIFHWHGETFTLPEEAQPIFSTDACRNQGFVLDSMMALQCHIEIEEEDVPKWIKFYNGEIPVTGRAVQSTEEMQRDLPHRIERLQKFADRLYNYWLQGFRPDKHET